jgi:hypothetical protein
MKRIGTTIALVVLAASVAHGQILYKISGNGLKQPSYIVGTYHLAPASFANDIKGLKSAMEACEQVYGEVDIMDAIKPESKAKVEAMQYLPEGKTLASVLTSEQLGKLNGLLREVVGKDLNNEAVAAQMGRLTPAALSSSLALIAYMKETPNLDPTKLLDGYFQQEALAQGKKVGGFETLEFQMDVLYGAPLEDQIKALMCLVENFEETVDMADFVAVAYFAQDLEQLEDITAEESESACGSTPEEEDKLIYNRNAAWVKAMPAIMQGKPTLFAVGAAHLCGDRGVLALLRAAGYTVEGVKK